MRASPAARRTGSPVRRRYYWLLLAAALFLAAALLASDIWITRAGAVIAFIGGLISAVMAWREVKIQRRAFQEQSALELHAHGEKLHAERTQHVQLLDVMQLRNADLRSRLAAARIESARLGHEASSLRGDNASLRAEVTQLNQDLAELHDDNVVLRAEVARLSEEETASILGLPRRASGPVGDDAEVLWSDDNYPTVVDLRAVTAPFSDEALRQQA